MKTIWFAVLNIPLCCEEGLQGEIFWSQTSALFSPISLIETNKKNHFSFSPLLYLTCSLSDKRFISYHFKLKTENELTKNTHIR